MHGEIPKKQLKAGARRGRRWLATVLVLAAVVGALAYVYYPAQDEQGSGGRRHRFAASGPAPVLAADVKRADVPVYLEAVGTTRALKMVTVRPQVDGKLLSVNFDEGQQVKQGDVLARIDPVIYQAQLDQAKAKKAQDEALLANARNDLARYQTLAAANAINKQQADTQKSLVAQYTAQVQADQAAIENAQAMLGYTTITAPIDGRTGIRQVDAGNYVRAADANSTLVTITQIQPISVLFNLPQQDLMQVNDAFAKGPLTVEALRSDTNAVIDRGRLVVVDNQVDPTTGTVKLKAEFPNAQHQLWPGQFVNVRLLIRTLQEVVVIPTGAVQRGPNGTFVYVVGEDNKATVRPIKVARQDENQAVIESGVQPPERVVTTGFVRLTDGSQVSIGSGEGATPPNGAAPQHTSAREGETGAVGSGAPREHRRQTGNKGGDNGGGTHRPNPPQ
jgi:multidrug efflux system membrane fusion protein